MTPEQFCYWLQGYVEITENSPTPTKSEWLIIKDHLKLVFKKVTPDYNSPTIPRLTEIHKPLSPSYDPFNPPPNPFGPIITC